MKIEKVLPPDVTLVCKLTKDGIIKYVNPPYLHYLGYSEQEIIGQSHEKIQDPQLPQVIANRLWEKIYNNEHFYYITKNITKNSESLWTLVDGTSRISDNRKTAVYLRRKFVPNELKEEIQTLYKTLYEIETQGGGNKVAEKYLNGWLEDRNVKSIDDYIIEKFGGEKKLKAYFTSEVSDEELFKIEPDEMKIDEILDFVKKRNKKKRFGFF